MMSHSDERRGRCGSCAYAEPDPENLQNVACHKHPPQLVVPVPGQVISIFPAVQRTHWCDEHKPHVVVTGL